MSKNHDIDSTRQVVVLARNAGIGVKPGLVLAILQELEETRAKHRKEWGRAEKAEQERFSQRRVLQKLAERNMELSKFKDAYSLQAQELEAAEAAVQRVREVAHYSNKVHREAILEALDGGEQE